MLFLFIKEYHRVMSRINFENKSIFISEEINEWVQGTWAKYQVNLLEFTYQWADYFWNNDMWPTAHRRKSQTNFRKYDYDYRQKSNLFNIDSLYRKMPKKPYMKGRKQELEILIMYHWLHSIEGDDSGYWQEYLEKAQQGLE